MLFNKLGTVPGLAASSPSKSMPVNASNRIPTNSISCLIGIESASDTARPLISPGTYGKVMDRKEACQSGGTALVEIELVGF